MSPPPAKRRRTSSPRPLLSPQTAGSPPPRPSRRPASPLVQPRNGRRHPLDGFNDEGDSGEEAEGVTGTGSTRTSSDMDHQPQSHEEEEEEEEEHCAICLSPIENRAVVSPCHHGQFCWGCIRAWTDQSRKCPLCLGPIEHLIHNIRSAKDYQNHYLLPLPTASSSSDFVATFPPPPAARGGSFARSRPGAATMNPTLPRHALYGRQSRTSRFSSSNRVDERDEATWREREQERALERRRYIYREGLYAKHVASNRYTGFKPFSPHTFSRNEELKAKVIKFIRRELQVFPAVDVAFLTTYLVTIASQLDLRSPSAIRLISDFLSEEDAQHLVHEISTFARSPFTSLEGYDRFVQYGRPQRRLEEEEEAAEEGGSMSRGVSDRPRFEEHMSGSRGARGGEEEQEWERERRSSAGRPPFPSSTGRDSTSGNYRSGRSPSPPSAPLPRRYSSSGSAPNGRPPPPPASNPRHRQPYRPVEPNWRERDQRYTGSYYATAASESRRGDGGNGGGRRGRRGGFVDGSTASHMRGRGGGGGPASSAVYEEGGGGGRRRYESRGRRKSPSLSLALPTRDSMSPPPPRRRRRRYSADDNDDDDDDGWPSRRRFSPAPLPRSYKDERETSPLPTSETRVQGPSRSPPSPRSRSPARPRSRSRSRSKTPLQRPEPLSPLPSPPPPPPLPAAGAAGGGPAIDSELDDAISLVGPSFSIGPGSSKSNNSPLPSPLTATPAGPPPPPTSSRERPMSSSSTFDTSAPPLPPPPRGKPTLTIFGAARRLLGNGRVVTLARDGRASLQAQSDVFRNAGASASYGRRGAAGANSRPRQQESCYNQATPNRPTASSSSSSSSPAASAMLGPPRKPLLGRLGGIVPPPISTSSTAPVPSASSRDAAASPTTPTSSKATSPADSLRARLHARLTAEYRQALAASSRSTTLPPVFEDPDGAVPPATTTTTTTTNKSDLRSLLQARLQAEKALASEDLVRTRTAASLASARDAHERVNEPTVFSQETRDLLMARLDEERRFVDEEAQAGRPASSTSASAFDTYEYGHDLAYDDGYYDYNPSYRTSAVFMDDHAAAELAPNEKDLVASSPSSSSAALAPASVTPSTSESSLKAALLAKRRAAIQDELKKFSGQLKEKEMRQKLMMQKRRSGTTAGGGGGGGGDASAEAQARAGP
ncbi:hypothetical protein RHOSPDRAFT_34853 [Rhodotorula sp. JG-1b]|nr:hypothetical protein RHOSPDRAFT_34853 [Rhodotorula sp. JG-1b]